MAPSASKFQTLPFNCYELGHTWNPSCSGAALDVGFYCFKESFKIYLSCYVISLVASRRCPKSKEDLLKIFKDISQSSAFLSTNGFGFVLFFCILRKAFGSFNFLSVGFLPAFLGSYLAILVEKKHRRSLLALYTTNVASETIFRMLRSRGIVGNIKHFDLVMFIVSASALLFSMKKGENKADVIDTIFKLIIGKEEFSPRPPPPPPSLNMESESEALMGQREANNVGPGLVIGGPEVPVEIGGGGMRVQNGGRVKRDESYRARFIRFVLWMHRQVEDIACHLERMVAAVYEGRSHDTCPHSQPCFTYWLQGLWTRFGAGFGLQAALQTLVFIRSLLSSKSRAKIPQKLLLSQKSMLVKCILSGVGLSSVCLSFRLFSCAFRWLLGNEDPIHALAAGVVSSAFGFLLLRPPSTIALYLFFKAAQIIISESHKESKWKTIEAFDSVYGGGWCLLFALSTGVLFHAGMLEPQNLKPSYYNFLYKVTGRKLHDINRHLLTIYGTKSNSLMGEFWPVFDRKFISSQMSALIREREKLGKGNEFIKELTLKYVN